MEDLVAEKRIKTVVSLLAKNEKLRRLYLAAEAESLGWGGMVYVSKIAGVDKDTVTTGKKDLVFHLSHFYNKNSVIFIIKKH